MVKKRHSFLILILTFLVAYSDIYGAAGTQGSELAIARVTKDYLKSFAAGNIESAMNQVSKKYTDFNNGGKPTYYDGFRVSLKEYMDRIAKVYSGLSLANLKIIRLEIKNNRATLEFVGTWAAFNLNTRMQDSGDMRRIFYLVKENGLWRICRIQRIDGS